MSGPIKKMRVSSSALLCPNTGAFCAPLSASGAFSIWRPTLFR